MAQLLGGHIRLRPAVGGNDAFVSLRGLVDDSPYRLKVRIIAWSDHKRLDERRGVWKAIKIHPVGVTRK
jgi:hypothetical protein